MKVITWTLRDGREGVIREAVASDAAELLECHHRIAGETTFISFTPEELAMSEEEEIAAVEKARAADNCLYLVARVDGQVVGTLHFTAGDLARVRHAGGFGIAVCRECWGMGIGGRLLDALLAWARVSGVVTKINLRVRTDNHRAIQLYENKGFVREGTIRRDFMVDGEPFDHHLMGLVL